MGKLVGMGAFGYIPFILVFLKFEGSSYDMRQSVHKTMGVVSYLFILTNFLMGFQTWYMDLFLFFFASYFFYRAMSQNFEELSKPGIATMLAFGLLTLAIAWGTNKPAPKPGVKSEHDKALEAELRKTLEALQSSQNAAH
jgi:hypothetical protein